MAAHRTLCRIGIFVAVTTGGLTLAPLAAHAGGVTGAVFTTDSTCTAVNDNTYAFKTNVFLDGGPARPGAAGLPDGSYFVQVTAPDGTLLGTSVGSANETPIVVSDGDVAGCNQLYSIVHRADSVSPGFNTTTNPGGVYKVWVSTTAAFAPADSKTDTFKVENPCTQATCG